jgi:hypothetical protein
MPKNELARLGQFDNPFQGLSENEIFYIVGNPIEFRANCSGNGGFAKGDSTKFMNSIEMQILFFKEYPNTHLFPQTFETPNDWACLYFIYKNALCTMFLKGQGLENFYNTFKDVVSEGLVLGACVITATMKNKETTKGNKKFSYLVPYFEYEKATEEQIQKAKDFWELCEFGNLIYSKSVNEIVENAKEVTETVTE